MLCSAQEEDFEKSMLDKVSLKKRRLGRKVCWIKSHSGRRLGKNSKLDYVLLKKKKVMFDYATLKRKARLGRKVCLIMPYLWWSSCMSVCSA